MSISGNAGSVSGMKLSAPVGFRGGESKVNQFSPSIPKNLSAHPNMQAWPTRCQMEGSAVVIKDGITVELGFYGNVPITKLVPCP